MSLLFVVNCVGGDAAVVAAVAVAVAVVAAAVVAAAYRPCLCCY